MFFEGTGNPCCVEITYFLEAHSIEHLREKSISLEAALCSQWEFHRDFAPTMAVVDQVVCFLEVRLVTGDRVLDEE